jgi:predicted AAA+ superfamily ATPase
VYEYLKNIYNSIILKDIVSRYNIRNLHLFDDLIHYLAGNFGTLLSAKSISDFLKNQKLDYSSKIILEYLKYIENAFFIARARRYDIQGKRIFEIGDKFYFSDLGLRNTIIPYKTNDINLVLENLVYNHLLTIGFNVHVGKLGNIEIDFVAERSGIKLYIQVAYIIADANVYQREFGNLLQIKDNFPKYVVSMDEITGNSPEGIIHLNIKEFLVMEL